MSTKAALAIFFALTVLAVFLIGVAASSSIANDLVHSFEHVVPTAQLGTVETVMYEHTLQLVILLAAVTAIILIGVFWYVSRVLLTPLNDIMLTLRNIGAAEFKKVSANETKEIEQLAKEINTMAAQLQWQFKSLKDRADQKTKEAMAKSADLETLNHFMAGREFKMIELKNEITELRKRLDSGLETNQKKQPLKLMEK